MVAVLLNAKLVYVYIKLTMHYTNIILMKCIFRRNIKIKRLLVATCCGLNQVSIDDLQIQIYKSNSLSTFYQNQIYEFYICS